MRVDQQLIAQMIAPGSRVLDVGSGDGALIDHLYKTRSCDARGIEIDMQSVTQSIANGLPVVHGDADHDLAHYPDDTFDFVVLQRTLQAVEQPREVLRQMLRIGRHAIVSFPNFGHWRLRFQLLTTGRMPMTQVWSTPWYITPNIHPCTIRDFLVLCDQEHYCVQQWLAIDEAGARAPWRRSVRFANLFGEQALFLLSRR